MFFEILLRSQGNLVERNGDTTRRILTPVISEEGCLNLIIQHKEFYLQIIANSGDDKIDFSNQLDESMENLPASSAIEDFRRELNTLIFPSLKIRSASYYTDKGSIDVTQNLKERVEVNKKLHFRIGNDIANNEDPDPGVVKKLAVEYEFESEKHHKTFNEHEFFRLP
jgi:hypothetical protein